MANGEIRVNPPSIRAYANSADEIFQSIRRELESMVSAVVGVQYYGPNAKDFKTKCGALAAELATAITSDMRSIAEAVQASTSNIMVALGGPPVTIQFNGGSISPPAVPDGGEDVGANISALESLQSTVKSHFSAVNAQFDAHLGKLVATDWTGKSKENAVQAVTTFTNGAKGKVEESSTRVNTYVQDQIEALRRGDV